VFQKFIALGRLTKDPEMNPLADGTARARFTLAVDRRMSKEQKEKELAKGKDGKTADFFDVVAWRKLAENVCQFKKKGDMVLV
jgi:single-strand DNA-binding protein